MSVLTKENLLAVVNKRIESRYRRLLFVHRELAKLKPVSNDSGSVKPKPGESFEDFVFKQIDFSVYKKIDEEEFCLLFDKGLSDYDESFFQKNFAKSRREISRIINDAYVKEGPFYLCKKPGLLLMSIMRTMHSSLDFAPLLDTIDFIAKDQLKEAAELLDGALIRHNDGMETKLFIPREQNKGKIPPNSLLCGTFYPLGKACTLSLVYFP